MGRVTSATEVSVREEGGVLGAPECRRQCIAFPLMLGYLLTPRHHPLPSLRDKACAHLPCHQFFPHLLGSWCLRATSLSCSSLFSKDGEADDLPTAGILAIPASHQQRASLIL